MAPRYAEMTAATITFDTERGTAFFQDKMAYTMSPMTLKEIIDDPEIQIVDVRRRQDYEKAHIPKAISIPADDMMRNLDKLSKEKVTILYCYTQQCHLAARTAVLTTEQGYPTTELEGGFDVWKNEYDYPVVS